LLDLIRTKLRELPAEHHQPEHRENLREAAVLLAVTRADEPSVVFIKRAEHLNSHSGQVAFPGGMWEPGDKSLLHTALRESEEEIALPPGKVDVIATLPTRSTIFGVRVIPYVGLIPAGLDFVPEPGELDAVFEVPLSYLGDPGNLTRTRFEMRGGEFDVPCYLYKGFCIWGFTLGVLAEFLDHCLDVSLDLQYRQCG
jgi:8-oxo-dGTP pyrophosphatase MutT (NUDIX family)